VGASPTEGRPLTPAQETEVMLRGILLPLDGAIGSSNSLGCLAFLGGPAAGAGAAKLFGWGWLGASATALVVIVALVVVSTTWDDASIRRAAARFHEAFPPGHPLRARALDMLPQLAYPNKAHEKLAQALGLATPVAAPPPEESLGAQLGAAGIAPAAAAPQGQPPPAPAPAVPEAPNTAGPTTAPPRRPAPDDRVIPLEPFPHTGPDHGGKR
jgi:hypothetical protein